MRYHVEKHNGCTYYIFDTIRGFDACGCLRASYDVDLGYCVDDDQWFGDYINTDRWCAFTPEEAYQTAKEFGLVEMIGD